MWIKVKMHRARNGLEQYDLYFFTIIICIANMKDILGKFITNFFVVFTEVLK